MLIVMAVIMLHGGFNAWQTLPSFLTENVKAYPAPDKLALVKTSIETLSLIVEDCTSLFESDQYASLVEEMFTPVCALLQRPSGTGGSYGPEDLQIKAAAVKTVNMLILTQTQSVTEHMNDYAGHLLLVSDDFFVMAEQDQANVELYGNVLKSIVDGLTNIMELRSDVLL